MTRDNQQVSSEGLMGFDLKGKTLGAVQGILDTTVANIRAFLAGRKTSCVRREA